jgi:hypothetical protein
MKRRDMRWALGVLCGVLLFTLPGWAGRLHGHVVDNTSGEALIGASVNVLAPDGAGGEKALRGAATNLDGYFVITGLQDGACTVVASYQGFETLRLPASVKGEGGPLLEIRLVPGSVAMATLQVTAEKTEQELQQEQVYAGNIRLDKKQLDLAPVLIQRDLLRSLLTIPGVLPTNDFSSDLNVRGSRADENLVLLDGVEVYNPNHLGGVFSAFIPSAVKHTDLMRSSWPAQYGGRLGAVLQVTSREGNQEELDGEIGVGILATTLQVSAPTAGLDNSSWLLALRRTYVDLATRAFTSSELPYHFTDAQMRFNWDVGEQDRLSMTGYFGDDVFDAASLRFTFGNRATNLNWRHVWNTRWYSRAILAWSRFRTELDFGGRETVFQTNHINDLSTRLQLEYHHDDELTLESGLSAKTLETDFQSWIFNSHKWDVQKQMSELALYAQASWRPHPLLIVEPGLRAVLFRAGGLADDDAYHVTRLEPRVGLKAHLDENLRLKLAWGLYNQGLQQFRRDGSTFNYIWVAMDRSSRPARASHWTAGVEWDVAPGTLLEVEAYHKALDHVAEAKPQQEDHLASDPSTNDDLFYHGRGEAFGGDVSLRRSQGLWTGQAGYSLGWAVRQLADVNQGKPFYAAFDKRHNLNLQVSRAFPHSTLKGWPFRRYLRFFRYNESSAGLTWRLSSGPRYTQPESAIWLGGDGLNGEEGIVHAYGDLNAEELAAYSRVDLAWTFTHRKAASSFECRMGLLNLFNSPNYWDVSFDYVTNPGGQPRQLLSEGIRRLPSLELTWSF